MKKLLFIIAVTLTMLMPVGGCKVFKKVSKQKTHTNIDSTHKATVSKSFSNVDSSQLATVISKKDNATVKSVTITESVGEAKTEAFTITSSFKLDPNAGGDTLRFVSMEDDRMKVEIFADKKTCQGTAKITNKGQTVRMPFRQVNITNASVNKDFDSAGFDKKAIINTSQIDSSALVSVRKKEAVKTVEREIKKTKLPSIVWFLIIIAGVISVLLLLYNRASIWGWLVKIFWRK